MNGMYQTMENDLRNVSRSLRNAVLCYANALFNNTSTKTGLFQEMTLRVKTKLCG